MDLVMYERRIMTVLLFRPNHPNSMAFVVYGGRGDSLSQFQAYESN